MTGLFSASDLSSFQKQQQQLHNSSTTTTTAMIGTAFGAVSTTTHLQKLVADADIMNQQQHHHSNNQHQQVTSHLRSNHDAPTAGAAAANAIAMGLAGGRGGAKIAVEEEQEVVGGGEQDMDVYLLSEIISLGVHLTNDVVWTDLRSDNAEDRWYELLDEWQLSITDDSLLALPVSEIAQLILDRKTSAQRAAETVEAVDLPPVPESLQV
jgi:hypothetical protein